VLCARPVLERAILLRVLREALGLVGKHGQATSEGYSIGRHCRLSVVVFLISGRMPADLGRIEEARASKRPEGRRDDSMRNDETR
jgi:hypothetical protein